MDGRHVELKIFQRTVTGFAEHLVSYCHGFPNLRSYAADNVSLCRLCDTTSLMLAALDDIRAKLKHCGGDRNIPA